MKYLLTIHETIEHAHVLEAASEAEARAQWEHITVADYNGDEETIERKIITAEPTFEFCECGRGIEDCATFDNPEADHQDRE